MLVLSGEGLFSFSVAEHDARCRSACLECMLPSIGFVAGVQSAMLL
jgi:hypothetical protein